MLLAFSSSSSLEEGLARQRHWHSQGRSAVLELHPIEPDPKLKPAQGTETFKLDWIDT